MKKYGREPWLDDTVKIFRDRNLKTVVELGSVRLEHNAGGDGHAMFAFVEHAESIITVDIDPNATTLARVMFADHPNVYPVTMDGTAFLALYYRPIDLLYLDAMDPSVVGSQQFHLLAYKLAKRNLSKNSLILLDDCYEGGKGDLVIPEIIRDGYQVIFSDYMVLLGK